MKKGLFFILSLFISVSATAGVDLSDVSFREAPKLTESITTSKDILVPAGKRAAFLGENRLACLLKVHDVVNFPRKISSGSYLKITNALYTGDDLAAYPFTFELGELSEVEGISCILDSEETFGKLGGLKEFLESIGMTVDIRTTQKIINEAVELK